MTNFKPILFGNLTGEQKSDIELLEAHQAYYCENTAEGDKHPEYIKYSNETKKVRIEQAKKQFKSEQDTTKEKTRLALLQTVEQTIESNDCYYVATDDKIYQRTISSDKFMALSVIPWCRSHAIPETKGSINEVFTTFKQLGRTKNTVTFKYEPANDDELNIASRESWLQPTEKFNQDDQEWFDLLLDSVAGENPQVRDHIEQCIAWKYRHPEDHMVPMWLPYGAGGAGKNVFVEDVLKTIWDDGVTTTDREGVFGQWTGHLFGKLFVMIDETGIGQGDFNALKKMVGNKFADYNIKGGAKLVGIRNYAMYMMTSNDQTCAIRLTDSAIDRRFSVWKLHRSIIEILAERKGFSVSTDDNNPIKSQMLNLWENNRHRFQDKNAVAGWLNQILVKWSAMDRAPSRYVPDDLSQVIDEKKGPIEITLDDVFNWERFTFISIDALYERYRSITKNDFPAYKSKNKQMFAAEAKSYVAKYFPHIIYKKVNLYDGIANQQRVTTNVFITQDCDSTPSKKLNTRSDFVDSTGKHCTLYDVDNSKPAIEFEKLTNVISMR